MVGLLLVADIDSDLKVDPILQSLVAMAKRTKDFGMSVTPHVSGIIVPGTLISYVAYLFKRE